MRSITGLGLAAVLAAAAAAGCAGSNSAINGAPSSRVVVDGLAVSLELPARAFRPGQTFTVNLSAENVSGRPIHLDARTRSLYYLRLWRDTTIGWEPLRRYPQSEAMVPGPWTLAPGKRRAFGPITLTVEPDWPRGEMLRITGELNGRPNAKAAVEIVVESEEDQGP